MVEPKVTKGRVETPGDSSADRRRGCVALALEGALKPREGGMRYWRDPLDSGQIEAPRGEVHILGDRCKGCAFCVEYCPLQVLEMSRDFNRKGYHPPEVVDADACVNCGLCEMICPEFAIFCIEAGGLAENAVGPAAAELGAGEVSR